MNGFKYVFQGFCALFAILLLFFSFSQAFSEMLHNRPIKTGYWRGTEIEYLGGTVIIKINQGADSIAVDSLLAAHSCYVLGYSGFNGWALAGYDTSVSVFEKIDSLMANPFIGWSEPNGIVRPSSAPNDSLFQDSSQWNLWNTGKHGKVDADIDALEAWEIETGDSNLIIGVIDCGFPYNTENGENYRPGDYCHWDLKDTNKYILGYNCCDYVAGCISVADSARIADGDCFYSHGTAVTGIISAMTNNSSGVAGVIWNCKIYVIKLWPTSCGTDAQTAYNLSLAINLTVNYGAKIINISGGSLCSYEILEQAIERADSAKCLIVAAVGNLRGSCVDFPAGYATYANRDWNCCDQDTCPNYPNSCGHRNVIAVGGSTEADTFCYESNWSTDTCKVTVVAPDDVIHRTTSLNPFGPPLGENCTGYFWFYGTSAATPHVTGVAGLLQSYAIHKGNPITPDSIRTLIEWTADDMAIEGWDDTCGFGRVNALRALMAMDGYYPNATGYLRKNATWGDTLGDTIYVLGDVVIPAGCTLTIDQGAVVKFLTNDRENFGDDSSKCEIIVKGKLVVNGTQNDSVYFISCNPDSPWCGIRVDSAGSLNLNYCSIEDTRFGIRMKPWGNAVLSYSLIRADTVGVDLPNGGSVTLSHCHVTDSHLGIKAGVGSSVEMNDCLLSHCYTGAQYCNSASNTVDSCTFRDNITHGIFAQSNPNLLVDNCTFIDSADMGKYGILCWVNMTIKNSFFEGSRYGIKVEGQGKFTGSSPLIEECGFYNIVLDGILSNSSSNPTIQKCCFKGSYGEACIQVSGGNPYIMQCYMASDSNQIPNGLRFTGNAKGTIRQTTIWDYNDCAIKIIGTLTTDPVPDFGNSDFIGCNWFEEPDSGEYYIWSSSDSLILAKSNYWEEEDTSNIRSDIVSDSIRPVDIDPVLTKCNTCYPYYADLCSGLPPSDPLFNPCKIAVIDENDNRNDEKERKETIPTSFSLSQNYPNPFNPETVIKYDLPQTAHVKLTIYNVMGQRVKTLVDEILNPGYKTYFWDGKDEKGKEVASGIYFFRLKAGNYEEVKRMVLLR